MLPNKEDLTMKITKEQLKQIIKEELEAIVEGDSPFRGPKFHPTKTGFDVPVTGKDAVSGKPLRNPPMPMRKGDMPEESLEDEARGVIQDLKGMIRLGLPGTVEIPNPELKDMILSIAEPEVAARVK